MSGTTNKVRFNLKSVHFAPLTLSGSTPNFGSPVPIPGAVSLKLTPNGEAEKFYADGGVYYVINNNGGYDGDLEIALIPDEFRVYALGEAKDDNNVLIESSDSELKPFALLFEFDGDQHHIRHVLYNCTASRPSMEGKTNTDKKEVQTETLSLNAAPLPDGRVKAKTGDDTSDAVYNNWYNVVYLGANTLASLTVTSIAGTASGDSNITVSGYTLKSGESYKYKTAAGTAPSVAYGETVSDWTALSSGSDITPAGGHTKIAVVAVDSNNKAVAYGSATITANT